MRRGVGRVSKAHPYAPRVCRAGCNNMCDFDVICN